MDKPLPQLKDGAQTVFFQAGGEWSFLRTPRNYKAAKGSGAVPLILWCRGMGSYVRENDSDWMKKPPAKAIVDKLVDSGYAVAGSEMTGDHYGRPSAVAALIMLYRMMLDKANVDADKVGMYTSAGMGGTVMWLAAIGPLHGKIKGVVFAQAVASLASMLHYRKEVICKAFGMPDDTPDDVIAAATAGSDPLPQTELMLKAKGKDFVKGLPKTLLISGDKDANVIYEKNAVALHKLLTAHGADSILHPLPGVAHVLHEMLEPIPTLHADFFKKVFGK
jgi:hypothetical protein